ncbi:MAG: aminopeptidase [Magnetococcus sp. DMHC-1]|nr:aminopeptidase [Magnetococcales bacterium]
MEKIWFDMSSPFVSVAERVCLGDYTLSRGVASIVARWPEKISGRWVIFQSGCRTARRIVLMAVVGLLMSGCSTVHYYLQAIGGEIDLLARRQSVAELLEDPNTPAHLRERLLLAKKATDFAVNDLALQPTGSFRSYADLGRPYVVWGVYATPVFSLQPVTWCFPIVGCMTYRGFFSETDARRSGQELAEQEKDVYITGAPAYSTLGWFDDPLLNTFLDWPEPWLVGLIFHEMAHATLYISDDTTFNESYAEAVGQIGIERWLQQAGKHSVLEKYHRHLQRRSQCLHLIQKTRTLLGVVYASQRTPSEMQAVKSRILAASRASWQRLAAAWGGSGECAAWFTPELNNAQLVALTTYNRWVPAFLSLLAREGGSMPQFHQAARKLGNLPPNERLDQLQQLAGKSPPQPTP